MFDWLTSKIWAKCVSLLVNMALMQWIAYLAWRGGPLLAFACSTGSKTLGGAGGEEHKKTQQRELSTKISTVYLKWANARVGWQASSCGEWMKTLPFNVRETLFHLAACVLEDLQSSLGHLLVVHLQTSQQRLKRLCGVERHGMGERQHLRGKNWIFGIRKRIIIHLLFPTGHFQLLQLFLSFVPWVVPALLWWPLL